MRLLVTHNISAHAHKSSSPNPERTEETLAEIDESHASNSDTQPKVYEDQFHRYQSTRRQWRPVQRQQTGHKMQGARGPTNDDDGIRTTHNG